MTTYTDQNGDYWFNKLSPGGNYTITPSKAHYNINPSSQTLNNLTTSQGEINFTAELMTYSIGGRVADVQGNAISGVTMTLTKEFNGAQVAIVQTDQNGNYTFAGLNAFGHYTVTPSKTDYIFTSYHRAPSITVSNLTENRTRIDFTGTLYYSIRGRVTDPSGAGLSGVKLTMNGGGWSRQTSTDANGDYAFAELVASHSYTITPAKVGYAFNPFNRVYENLSGHQAGADFAATLMYHSISGRITDSRGAGLSGITVALSGTRTANAQTDANGNYSFADLPGNGHYSITLTKTGYVFNWSTNPHGAPGLFFDGLDGNISNANSTGFLLYNISGRVTDASGAPLSGIPLTLRLNRYTGPAAPTTQTDANGDYVLTNVAGYSTVTPSQTGYVFNPQQQSFDNPPGDQTANFSAAAIAVLQFSAPTYEVNEGAGRVQLTVIRSSDTASPVTVDYETGGVFLSRCDDSRFGDYALERCDFATAHDTLRFAPGETAKSFTIIITDDAYAERSETVTLTLRNPTGGAVLGGNSTTTLLISDNDTQTQASPANQSAFSVRQHYIDFLSREPEQAGFDAWLGRLNGCAAGDISCDSIEVSSSFFRSEEFQLKGFFIYRFYKASLGRMPRYVEIVPDMMRVTAQTDAELPAKRAAFTDEWMTRTAFKSRYDGLSNNDYVDRLLQTAGVALTEREQLIGDLNSGAKSRAEVLRQIVESQQVLSKEYNEAFVAMQYFGYLRRDPEADGLAAWLRVINNNPADYRTMVHGFVTSTEYKLRFGRP